MVKKPLEEHAGPIPEAWEGEERSYIFECRLGRAQQLKDLGNGHFKRSEWVQAHARYKKALDHAHFDELQSWDLMDHHKEMLAGVAVPVKLNFVVCILKLLEAGGGSTAYGAAQLPDNVGSQEAALATFSSCPVSCLRMQACAERRCG